MTTLVKQQHQQQAQTENHSNKRYAYTSNNEGVVITRNRVSGLNLNSISTSDIGQIEHEGPDIARLTISSGEDFKIPSSEIAAVLLKKSVSDSGSLHANAFDVIIRDDAGEIVIHSHLLEISRDLQNH